MPGVPNAPAVREDDVSDDGSDTQEWMLGFVEEVDEPCTLLRHRFPSKVGGRPAWLNPRDLPLAEQLTCGASNKPMDFLLQVYAPPPEDGVANPAAFHRTVFVFVSPEGGRLSRPGAVRALRCQLPRDNAFYGHEPAPDDQRVPVALDTADAPPPGRDPWQVADAEASSSGRGHAPRPFAAAESAQAQRRRGRGGGRGDAADDGPGTRRMYPEYELVVEAEGDVEAGASEDPQVARLVRAYQQRVAVEGDVGEDVCPADVVAQVEQSVTPAQAHYAHFQACVAAAPDQCLRYCFSVGAKPLCPAPGDGASHVPPCGLCGGPRVFEFQIMPQLLNYLDLEVEDEQSLDWGTIAVYSCQASCSIPATTADGAGSTGSAYAEEFVWVQDAL